MFDRLWRMFSHSTPQRKLVRHTALAFRDGEIGFVSTEVNEADFRRKLRGLKGEFLVRAKPDGGVEAYCNSCLVDLVVAWTDQLCWFRCPRCHGISFNPIPNVNRDVQFAIQDGRPFEHQSNYVRALPPGLVPPFSAGDAAWAKSSHAVIPLPDQPVGGSGVSDRQEVESAIEPYVQKARSTYPDAKRRFLTGLPDGARFFTTVRLQDDAGRIEVLFVQVMKIDSGQVTGTIASDVTTVTGFRKGQVYTFTETEVMDWTIANPDGTQEGNIVGRFLAEWKSSSRRSLQRGVNQTFLFTIENVFYDAQKGLVLVAGAVNEGTVTVGASLTVQCRSGDVAVILEDIVTLDRGKVQQASSGQEACLVLKGIRKEQPAPGDRVVANRA